MLALMLVLAIQTQTTCNQIGTSTFCNTTAPPPVFRPMPVVPYQPVQPPPIDFTAIAAERERSDARFRELGYYPECAGRFYILAGCSRAAHDEAVAGAAARTARPALQRAVNQALASGDCPGAIRLALEGNDMALAREAREFCRP